LPRGPAELAKLVVMLSEHCAGLSFQLLEPLLDRSIGSRGAAQFNETG
jgi:hypothetical protein